MILVLIALMGFSVVAHGQINFKTATPISKTDAIYPVLKDMEKADQERYENGQGSQVLFSPWVAVHSASAALLFPNLRFASVGLWEHPDSLTSPPPPGFPPDVELTVAVDIKSNRITDLLWNGGEFEAFGRMLARNLIRITDEQDAKTVWDALCAIHNRHWEKYPAIKISDTVWHLGNSDSRDGNHYFYEVILDRNQVVQSGKLKETKK